MSGCLRSVLVGSVITVAIAAARANPPERSLAPRPLEPLPLGSIKPARWLKGQLELQAGALSGHLDEVWPDIKESAWIGGKAEGWERVPYWLDGLVPLAYSLDSPELKAKVQRYIDYILEHPQPDGWLGPLGDGNPGHKPYDPWPLFPLFKALRQYQEATGDPRVIPALSKCARRMDEVITRTPLSSWGKFRVADLAVSLYWLYERTHEPALLDLANKAFAQSHDWAAQWAAADLAEKYRKKTAAPFELDTHGVNTGMALKYAAVRSRLSRSGSDILSHLLMLGRLDEYHGQVHGLFTCDEHLAGPSPSQGTELCTVVEALYALEETIAILGAPGLDQADRLERIAFNALPATFKKDLTAHQYDQQVNQVVCQAAGPHVYVNNGPESNLFGLEPNFGCCTANLHQGWPKLTSHLWMKTDAGGLVPISYAPCVVETTIQDKPVRIEVITDYPFRHEIRFRVTVAEPVAFPLDLRVPYWANDAALVLGEGPDAVRIGLRGTTPDQCDPCGTVRLDRTWRGTTPLALDLRTRPRLWTRLGAEPLQNGGVGILYGPLVFALPIATEWKKYRDRPGDFDDWEVFPKSPWNYALVVPEDLGSDEPIGRVVDRPMSNQPFSVATAPLAVVVPGRRLPDWGLERGAAAPPPAGLQTSREPIEDLTLIPYGCTDLRIAEFPVAKKNVP